MENPHRKKEISEFASQEREKVEAEDGAYRSDPWVQSWKGFHWLVNKELFKMAVGSESDLLAYAEMKHEKPELWQDEFILSFGDDGYWTGSIYVEALKAGWAELWFSASLINIRPFYYKMTFPNYEAFDNYDIEDYGNAEDLETCVGFYTDVDFAPIHAYLQGNVASCLLSFIEKIWHPDEALKIHCGFDSNTIMKSPDVLIFRGWKGSWTIWESCGWI